MGHWKEEGDDSRGRKDTQIQSAFFFSLNLSPLGKSIREKDKKASASHSLDKDSVLSIYGALVEELFVTYSE